MYSFSKEVGSVLNEIPENRVFRALSIIDSFDIDDEPLKSAISFMVHRRIKDNQSIKSLAGDKTNRFVRSFKIKLGKDNKLPYKPIELLNHEITKEEFKEYKPIQNIKHMIDNGIITFKDKKREENISIDSFIGNDERKPHKLRTRHRYNEGNYSFSFDAKKYGYILDQIIQLSKDSRDGIIDFHDLKDMNDDRNTFSLGTIIKCLHQSNIIEKTEINKYILKDSSEWRLKNNTGEW